MAVTRSWTRAEKAMGVEQQGDAAMSAADVARGFYRRVAGFDKADRHLRDLDQIDAPVVRAQAKRRPNRCR
jgi:hypothetical protein